MFRRSYERCYASALICALLLTGLAAPAALAGKAKDAPMRIGVIDLQKILTQSAPGKAALQELDVLRNKLEAELVPQRLELEELQQRMKGPDAADLSDIRGLYKAKSSAYQVQQKDSTLRMKQLERELLIPLQSRVETLVQQYGREHGFYMVLDRSMQGMLYADQTVDITDGVIERMNAPQPTP